METQKRVLFVANVAKEHILKFHIPTIFAFNQRGWKVDIACSGDETIPCCNHQYKMCWKRTPFSFRTIQGIFALKRIIDSNRYDVVYCHTPVGGLVARLASIKARKSGTKVIYFTHGLHFYDSAPLINWLVYYPIEKILSSFTDMIITLNKEDYKNCCEKFSVKTVLVPGMGVNFKRLQIANKDEVRNNYRHNLGIKDSTIVLIYVAELTQNKNQKMLIDATSYLVQKGYDVCLILPGPEHDHGATLQYAVESGIKDKVLFLGWRDDVGELITAADICVASSIREGFGINLLESMYCGLPVVATRNRGHEMVIDDGINGFLVDINDFKKMADRIELLIEEKDLFRNQNVNRYDCKLIAEQLVDYISSEC